jgi:hypothetical protein
MRRVFAEGECVDAHEDFDVGFWFRHQASDALGNTTIASRLWSITLQSEAL